MVLVWSIAIAVFAVIEIVTVGLASVWFVIGAVAALLAACFTAPLWLQIGLFFAVSLASLLLARPILVKKLGVRRAATNFDRVLEMTGTVTQEINNISAAGTVVVDGKEWTARSLDGSVIPAGTCVKAEYIDGVKLIVRPVGPVCSDGHPSCAAPRQ